MCVVPETNVLHQQELCDMGCRDHNERDVLNLYPAANAPNNGSYTWRGNYYGSALDYGFSDGTPSGILSILPISLSSTPRMEVWIPPRSVLRAMRRLLGLRVGLVSAAVLLRRKLRCMLTTANSH
jgi:hypothetical protein